MTPTIISRKEAKAAGLTTYFIGKPCKNGHIAPHYIAGACRDCARIYSEKANRRRQSDDPKSIVYRRKKYAWINAKSEGLLRYSTGIPCRNGHLSERYVSTKECINCLSRHRVTPEKIKEYGIIWKKRKFIENPDYFKTCASNYKKRYPLKARLQKLFQTAQRHGRLEKISLDFDEKFIQTLLEASLKNSGIQFEAHSLKTASLDKIDISKPISKENIQIVPRWYNMAKLHWKESDLIAAMAEYGFTRIPI